MEQKTKEQIIESCIDDRHRFGELAIGSHEISKMLDLYASQVIENQDPWISVKDKLPEDLLEYYLIWGEDEDGDRQVYIAYITTGLKWFYRGTSFQNVTHWKSLPTPPKTTE